MLLGSPSSEPCSLPGALTHPACPDTLVVGCPLCQTRGGGRRAGGSAHFAVCLSAPAVLPLRTDSPLRFSKAACQMPLRFAEGQCGSCAEGTGLKRGNMSVFLFNYYFGGGGGGGGNGKGSGNCFSTKDIIAVTFCVRVHGCLACAPLGLHADVFRSA